MIIFPISSPSLPPSLISSSPSPSHLATHSLHLPPSSPPSHLPLLFLPLQCAMAGAQLSDVITITTNGQGANIQSPLYHSQKHTCTCICTHTHVHTHTYIHIHTHTHTYNTHTHIHTHTHTYTHVHTHTYTHIHTHTHTYTHIHTHTHTHIHIHTHTCQHTLSLGNVIGLLLVTHPSMPHLLSCKEVEVCIPPSVSGSCIH